MQDYYAPADLIPVLALLLGWTTAYVVIIRRSLADGVCGMPLIPLAINLSWEFIFGFIVPDKPPANWVNIACFLADLGIVAAYLRHGRRHWPSLLPAWSFLPGSFAVLVLAFAGVMAATWQLKDWTGSYTGWGDNFLIFCAWLAMLLRRRDTRGQSMYIAVPAFFGSLLPMPLEWRITGPNLLIYYFDAGFVLVGSLYIVLLYRQFKHEGRNPWTTW